jgi:hypothetical protein
LLFFRDENFEMFKDSQFRLLAAGKGLFLLDRNNIAWVSTMCTGGNVPLSIFTSNHDLESQANKDIANNYGR